MSIIDNIKALGTTWYIEFFEDISEQTSNSIRQIFFNEAHKFELLFSRFDSNSLLSILNKGRSLKNPPTEFLSLLQESTSIYHLTDSCFDIRVGGVLDGLGYDKESSFNKTDWKFSDGIRDPIESQILIYSDEVRLKENIQIDLGGIAKGFFIDKFAKLLKERYSLKYFLINGGGDIYATSNYGNSIEILLQNPIDRSKYWKKIKIRDQAVCASSPFIRAWKTNTGDTMHHLIDSITQKPKSNFFGVFAIADSAMLGDVGATTLSVCPKDKIKAISKNLELDYLTMNSQD